MHRWYRAAHYATRIALIHERLPHAAIGADIICGFPGETDADHEATVELVERLPFSYLHVFSFSARPGTEAARRLAERSTPAAPAQVIRQRARELRAIGARKAAAFRAGQRGQTLRVLTLHTRGADERGPWTQALSDNYLTLRLPGHLPANQWQEAAAGADFFEEILKR
jgi:threonylcarbamoyladenosine tRNA methylthiotransferase MtaB